MFNATLAIMQETNQPIFYQENNIEAATSAKFALEQQQRMDAAKRKEDGTKWETKFFTPDGDGGGDDKWHYNNPLIDRINSKQIKSY